jgi:hypothetical protein
MKYLILMGLLLFIGVAVPAQADSGIAITATTIITGGSGSGVPFDSGGSYPNSMPNWALIFPSMNQPQSSSTSPSYIPVQQPVELPPIIDPQSTPYTPAVPETPVTPANPVSKMDWIVLFIIIGAAGLIGLVVWIISNIVDSYREDSTTE